MGSLCSPVPPGLPFAPSCLWAMRCPCNTGHVWHRWKLRPTEGVSQSHVAGARQGFHALTPKPVFLLHHRGFWEPPALCSMSPHCPGDWFTISGGLTYWRCLCLLPSQPSGSRPPLLPVNPVLASPGAHEVQLSADCLLGPLHQKGICPAPLGLQH